LPSWHASWPPTAAAVGELGASASRSFLESLENREFSQLLDINPEVIEPI